MTAPFHFRKIPTQVRGKLLFLPMYVRGFALLLKQSCDDQGRIELDGHEACDAIARLCAATPNERRRIAGDVDELVRVGYLRRDHDALVVVEQEQDWELIDSSRGSSARSSRTQRHVSSTSRAPHDDVTTTPARRHDDVSTTSQNHRSIVSAGNCSGDFDRREEKRRDKEKTREEQNREDQTREEGVQGEQVPQAPKTDPTPTLRKLDRSKIPSESSNHWSLQGTAYSLHDLRAEDQVTQTPTQIAASPSPSPRQGPLVTVVDPPTVPRSKDASTGVYGTSKRASGEGAGQAPAKPKAKGKASRAAEGGSPIPVDFAPTPEHYEFGRNLGLQKKHVDFFAGEMRDRALDEGMLSGSWNAKFRNWMRKGLEFRRGQPPHVPDPPEPRRPMPPPPPRDPLIEEGIRKLQERQAAGEVIDWRAAVRKVGRPFELPPIPPVSLEEFGIEADK